MEGRDLYGIIKNALRARRPEPAQDQNRSSVHAAVLIPIFNENGQYKVLFTKRTDKVETHKGQISFPGGAVDEEDRDLEETALREAHEEIGLQKEDVTVLGQIDDALTVVSDFIIHPFVGHIPHPYPFKINPHEVAKIIRVPLDIFVGGEVGKSKEEVVIDRVYYPAPVFIYQGEVIWGASARIMENFLGIFEGKIPLSPPDE